MAADAVDLEALEWRVRGAEGEWYERHTISQDLRQLATDALVAGWDTQSLRLLAGEHPSAYALDLGDLFARALHGSKRLERIHYWEPPEVVELGRISGLVDEWEGHWGRGRPAVETELRRAAQELLERRLPD